LKDDCIVINVDGLVVSRDETLKQMWPDGAQSITSVTKRPVTAGMDFKTSIIALVEKNLSMKVPYSVQLSTVTSRLES